LDEILADEVVTTDHRMNSSGRNGGVRIAYGEQARQCLVQLRRENRKIVRVVGFFDNSRALGILEGWAGAEW